MVWLDAPTDETYSFEVVSRLVSGSDALKVSQTRRRVRDNSFMSGVAPHDHDTSIQLVSLKCDQQSEWTGFGTDDNLNHSQSWLRRRVGILADPAQLTTSFGTVGQWERHNTNGLFISSPCFRHLRTENCCLELKDGAWPTSSWTPQRLPRKGGTHSASRHTPAISASLDASAAVPLSVSPVFLADVASQQIVAPWTQIRIRRHGYRRRRWYGS